MGCMEELRQQEVTIVSQVCLEFYLLSIGKAGVVLCRGPRPSVFSSSHPSSLAVWVAGSQVSLSQSPLYFSSVLSPHLQPVLCCNQSASLLIKTDQWSGAELRECLPHTHKPWL